MQRKPAGWPTANRAEKNRPSMSTSHCKHRSTLVTALSTDLRQSTRSRHFVRTLCQSRLSKALCPRVSNRKSQLGCRAGSPSTLPGHTHTSACFSRYRERCQTGKDDCLLLTPGKQATHDCLIAHLRAAPNRQITTACCLHPGAVPNKQHPGSRLTPPRGEHKLLRHLNRRLNCHSYVLAPSIPLASWHVVDRLSVRRLDEHPPIHARTAEGFPSAGPAERVAQGRFESNPIDGVCELPGRKDQEHHVAQQHDDAHDISVRLSGVDAVVGKEGQRCVSGDEEHACTGNGDVVRLAAQEGAHPQQQDDHTAQDGQGHQSLHRTVAASKS